MPKKAFENLSEERQLEIYEKGIKLYTEMAYEEITLRVIQKTLEINPATFYRYFDHKEDFYAYLYLEIYNKYYVNDSKLLDEIQDASVLQQRELEFLRKSEDLPKDVIRKLVFEDLKEFMVPMYKRELQKQIYDGKLRRDTDIDLMAYIYATIVYNLEMYFREKNIDELDLRMKIKEYIFYGLLRHGIFKDDEDTTIK